MPLNADAEPKLLSPAFVPAVLALWRQSGTRHWLAAEGESMLPLIRDRDRLLLSHDISTVRRGSIIVFSLDDCLITHRVLKIPHEPSCCFLTKGDNSWSFDVPIIADQIFGHVLAIQRHDRLIMLDRRKWRTIGWLIAIATLAVATPYGWSRRMKARFSGKRPVPGVRLARRCCSFVLATLVKLVIRSN